MIFQPRSCLWSSLVLCAESSSFFLEWKELGEVPLLFWQGDTFLAFNSAQVKTYIWHCFQDRNTVVVKEKTNDSIIRIKSWLYHVYCTSLCMLLLRDIVGKLSVTRICQQPGRCVQENVIHCLIFGEKHELFLCTSLYYVNIILMQLLLL